MHDQNTSSEISVKLYRSLKRKLQHYEADNYDKIYLIPCNGSENWRELAEHSALIYYYEVCEKLNLKTRFFADTLSFYDEYTIGYIRTLHIDSIRANLKKVGLYKSEGVDGDFHIFTLSQTFTPNYLAELKQREEARRTKNLTVIGTNNLNPELHQLLVASATRLHRICNSRLDKLSSYTNGATIIRLADSLLLNYHKLTMLKKSPSDHTIPILNNMRSDIYELIINVQILGEIKLWNLETVTSISGSLFTIRDKIESQIKRTFRKEQKNGTR